MYVATVDIIPLMLHDTSVSTIFLETLAMMLGLVCVCARAHVGLGLHYLVTYHYQRAHVRSHTFVD